MTTERDLFAELSAPFPPEAVSWRVGSTNKKSWKQGEPRRGKPLCYIDARDVMDRLTQVLGTQWQCRYLPMPNGTACCEIGILISGEWVWRANGAGATDMEGDKGAYSDAFKRAAVMWGIGRYLYDIKSPWIELDQFWGIPKADEARLNRLLSGDKEPSARSARQTGEYPRLEKLLRQCKTLRALETVWRNEQAAIGALPDGWRSAITEEKDRCKAALEAAQEAAQ